MFTKSHSIKVDRVLYVKILINNEKMMIQLFIFQNFIYLLLPVLSTYITNVYSEHICS